MKEVRLVPLDLQVNPPLPPCYSLSLSYSCLLIIGPYLQRLQRLSGQLSWRIGQAYKFSQTRLGLCKHASGILYDHPVLGALAARQRCRLHVPPLRLQAKHGTAKANRGRADGDHDVLAGLSWSSTWVEGFEYRID